MNTIFSRASKNTQRFFFALAAMISVVGGFFVANAVFAVAPDATVSPVMVKGGSVGMIYSFVLTNNSAAPVYDITITAPIGFVITDTLVCPTGWAVQHSDASSVECLGNPNPTKGLFIASGAQAILSFSATAPSVDSVNPWAVEMVDNVFVSHVFNPITTVDASAPVTSNSDIDTAWHQGSVSVSLTPTDAGGSSVASTLYCVGAIDCIPSASYGSEIVVNTDGQNYVRYFSTDGVGNVETTKTAGPIKIDNTAPVSIITVGTPKSGNFITSATTISLSVDDSASGVVGTVYSIDDATAIPYTVPFVVGTTGHHTITYKSIDAIGNEESNKTLSVFVDDTAPVVGAITISHFVDGFISGTSDISASVNDADGSGVASCEYTLDGTNWVSATLADGVCSKIGVDTSLSSLVNVRVTDSLGNLGTGIATDVTPDTTAPVTTDAGTDTSWHNDNVIVTLTPSDAGSNIASTEYKINGGSWTLYTAPIIVSSEGENTISYRSTDKVGNVEATKTAVNTVKIDKTNPTITDDNVSGWKGTDTTVTLAPIDSLSGIVGVKYCEGISCDLSVDGIVLTAPYELNFMTDGTNVVHYQTMDNAGNVSAVGTFTVQTDKTAPASASVTSVDPIHIVSSIHYVKGIVTLNASSVDAMSRVAKVEFYHSSPVGVKIGESTVSPYSLSWDTHSVSDGAHEVYVIAYDVAGNILESAHYPIMVDNTAPALVSNDITGGFAVNPNEMAFSPNGDIVMDAVSIDAKFTEEVVYAIKIKSGSTVVASWTGTATNPGAKQWTGAGNLGDGIYTIEITATDHAGNTFTDTTKTILLDNTAPAVNAGDDKITKTDSSVIASATDEGAGIATYSWSGTGLTFTPNNAKDTVISALADNGVYAATLTATDNVGNHASDTLSFTKDTEGPAINGFSSPVADAVYKTNNDLLTFNPSDLGTAIACSYKIGTGDFVVVPCTSELSVTSSLSGLVDGRNTVTVTVADEAGNTVSSETRSFVYDNNNTLTVGETADFTTIHEAISKATAGDTISIASGTYSESLLIEKKLSLVGTGLTKPIIAGSAPANYIVKINGTAANDSVIDNLEINGGTTNTFDYGILVNNSGNASHPIEIKNSIVKNIWNTSANGIGAESSSYVLVHNNSISSFHKRGIRFIDSSGKFYGNDVKGDSVDGTTRVQNLVTLWGGSNVEIYNNTLHDAKSFGGTQTWDSPAVFVSSYGGNGASYANIHDNEIYNGDTGIVVSSVYSTVDTSSADVTNNNLHDLNVAINFEKNTALATIHNNKFVNNVKNLDANDVIGPVTNAEANWWGFSTGPATESVFSNVDYRPWFLTADLSNLDIIAPTVTLSSTITSPTNVSPIVVSVAFGEQVTGFTAEDISVTNGTISEVTDSGFNVTPDSNETVTVDIAKDTVQDLSGNYNTASNVLSFVYDNVNPTATVAYSPDTLTNQDVVATMTANEPVTVNSEGGSTHTFTSNGEFTFNFTDAAGNNGTALATVSNIDKTAPAEVTLSGKPASLTNVTTADIIVGGTDVVAYKYKMDGATDYGAESVVSNHLTLSSLSDGSRTLSVIGRDEAGNWKAEATVYSWTIETVVPTVTTHTPTVNAVGVDPSTDIVVAFSEAVNLDTTKLTLKKGGDAVATTVTFDITGKVATIHPTTILASNSLYEVVLLSTIADTAGNTLAQTSWSFTTAVSYSIPLTKGWNLVSLPVVPVSTSIDSVLGAAKTNIETVWAYDALADKWSVYHGDNNGTSDLTNMTAGYGYWVNYTNDASSNLIGSGNLMQEGNSVPPSRKLAEGWNLIGYYQRPNTTSVSATNALHNNLDGIWTLLFGYDNTNKHITTLSGTDTVSPGQAFWVWLNSARSYTMGNI
ncbi:MAG: Ig-like domain-containing protein [Candidatus Parcubacteria bacterium]|nr:Ig-like domain-containing protein [Candidatus Parcubacteria bacterium]